jgi:predicted DCC family thiol-disulfide oxidoreductase YuxK
METPDSPRRPILYWDGDCGFCRRWVERWRATTGDSVEYRTLQGAPAAVLEAAGGEELERIVLQQTDGSLLTGAGAALTSLAPHDTDARRALGAYRRLPFFRAVAEACYAWVAGHRVFCARMTGLLWGRTTEKPTYALAGWLFPRLIGAIFLSAFVSLWVQIDGLAGSGGILPVAAHLEAVTAHFAADNQPGRAYARFPSLLWFGASDIMLHVWLAVGAGASLLLMAGLWPALAAFAAWACYLSFAATIPVFLDFQWDALLLETGFLVAFFAPWIRYLGPRTAAPARLARLLVWWLLFRLMFESGVVKLHGFDAAGRNTWLDGTALDFHYFTQPIPVWLSWWFAQLPAWFHRLSLWVVFFVELVLPFFMFGPRRLRLTAFWGFSLLMLLIMASGHYGFFNLLTIALGVTLIDDASWPRGLRRLFRGDRQANGQPARAERIKRRILPFVAAVLVVLTTAQLLLVLRWASPATLGPVLGPFAPFRSANAYGLFSVMTTERPEITIEASTDGVVWEPYRFRWKMEEDDTRLPFFMPHMPRLDWQMWFAALEYRASGQPPAWIMPLLGRLQEMSPAVLGLLGPGGAAEMEPAFFRLRLDDFRFADPPTHRSTERYWQVRPLPPYTIEGRLHGPR